MTPHASTTGNRTVDAVLGFEKAVAREKKIEVEESISIPREMEVADSVLCGILGNALDNAIEACKLCEDKKHIWFKCVQESGKIILSVKNTYCEMNRKKKEGLHGIGLKNVEHVITSYGGTYSIKKIQGKFIVTILFWMEE